MSYQQGTSQTSLRRVLIQITHGKLETAGRARASRFAARKNLLRLSVSSFKSLEVFVFHDCSGGNSRPSRPSGVGGGNFFMAKVSYACSIEFGRQKTPNAQRPMSKSAVASRMSWPLAFTLIALLIAVVVLIIFLRLESWS